MNTNVTVNRQTAITSSEVSTGGKTFRFEPNKNGVVITQGKNSFTFPNGAVGQAILAELGVVLGGTPAVAPAKRTRRTKAELEAANGGVVVKAKRVRRTKAQIAADNAAASATSTDDEEALNASVDALLASS
jgi:hypothetical protein